jgi:hypothetical protein
VTIEQNIISNCNDSPICRHSFSLTFQNY